MFKSRKICIITQSNGGFNLIAWRYNYWKWVREEGSEQMRLHLKNNNNIYIYLYRYIDIYIYKRLTGPLNSWHSALRVFEGEQWDSWLISCTFSCLYTSPTLSLCMQTPSNVTWKLEFYPLPSCFCSNVMKCRTRSKTIKQFETLRILVDCTVCTVCILTLLVSP